MKLLLSNAFYLIVMYERSTMLGIELGFKYDFYKAKILMYIRVFVKKMFFSEPS